MLAVGVAEDEVEDVVGVGEGVADVAATETETATASSPSPHQKAGRTRHPSQRRQQRKRRSARSANALSSPTVGQILVSGERACLSSNPRRRRRRTRLLLRHNARSDYFGAAILFTISYAPIISDCDHKKPKAHCCTAYAPITLYVPCIRISHVLMAKGRQDKISYLSQFIPLFVVSLTARLIASKL